MAGYRPLHPDFVKAGSDAYPEYRRRYFDGEGGRSSTLQDLLQFHYDQNTICVTNLREYRGLKKLASLLGYHGPLLAPLPTPRTCPLCYEPVEETAEKCPTCWNRNLIAHWADGLE